MDALIGQLRVHSPIARTEKVLFSNEESRDHEEDPVEVCLAPESAKFSPGYINLPLEGTEYRSSFGTFTHASSAEKQIAQKDGHGNKARKPEDSSGELKTQDEKLVVETG
jgi:hypothetical protein